MARPNGTPTSERLYNTLLLAYPGAFRRTYRREMVQTFRDCYRDVARNGAGERTRFWGRILYDLVLTASSEHVKSLLQRLTGYEREISMLQHPFHINVAEKTDIGKRATNDDNMTHVIPENGEVLAKKGALFVVVDGLAGHNTAELASEIAINTLREVYYQDQSEDVLIALVHAIQVANEEIYQKAQQIASSKGMGSAIVAVVLRGDMLYGANAGDCRAYVVRNGQAKQFSVDHSLVGEMVRKGEITEEEAMTHEKRNIITRCLGTRSTVEADTFTEQVQDGDILVLCTDGLTNLVHSREIAALVEQYEPEESTTRLIALANERGGDDNVTAIVVRISL